MGMITEEHQEASRALYKQGKQELQYSAERAYDLCDLLRKTLIGLDSEKNAEFNRAVLSEADFRLTWLREELRKFRRLQKPVESRAHQLGRGVFEQ